jgi:hypothetical protein
MKMKAGSNRRLAGCCCRGLLRSIILRGRWHINRDAAHGCQWNIRAQSAISWIGPVAGMILGGGSTLPIKRIGERLRVGTCRGAKPMLHRIGKYCPCAGPTVPSERSI